MARPQHKPGLIWRADRPTATHSRPASCAEVDCDEYRHGWITVLNETDYAQADLADLIRVRYRGRFKADTVAGTTTFRFEPGTECFKASTHRVAIQRPAETSRLDRATGRLLKAYDRPDQWLDDMRAEHERLGVVDHPATVATND